VRKVLLSLLTLTLAASGLVLGGASPAGASTISVSTPVRACTNLADGSCYAWTSFPAGTPVTMRCWRDESSYAGTVRWFWVDGPRQGFVSANHVSGQIAVPHCNTKPNVQAVRWAGTQLKQITYKDPVTAATIDSRGLCLKFVHDAWRYAGKEIGSRPRAIDFWNSPPSGTRVATTSVNAPVGALVFWRGTSAFPEGHVAISIGDGYAITTDESTIAGDTIQVMNIARRNSLLPGRYLGWIQY